MDNETLVAIDFETTGFDHNKDQIIEIGAAEYHIETDKLINLLSSTILFDGELKDEIKDVTGIEQWMVQAPFAIPLKRGLYDLHKMIKRSPIIVAHNLPFDFKFLKKAFDDFSLDIPEDLIKIDTMRDLPFPNNMKSKKLNHLLADHGKFNAFPHRAVFDAIAAYDLLSCYDFDEVLELKKAPKILIRAMVDIDTKDEAKTRGFTYNPKEKTWTKEIRKTQLKDTFNYPFKVKIISDTVIDEDSIPF